MTGQQGRNQGSLTEVDANVLEGVAGKVRERQVCGMALVLEVDLPSLAALRKQASRSNSIYTVFNSVSALMPGMMQFQFNLYKLQSNWWTWCPTG